MARTKLQDPCKASKGKGPHQYRLQKYAVPQRGIIQIWKCDCGFIMPGQKL